METLLEGSQTTRTTWIELSSIRTIGTIVYILKRSYGNAVRRLIEGYPRKHHYYFSKQE